ncbi:50S ribosomal protein L30 [Streptomyces sp. NPDC059766]|uniref:50S ribosomal protein L30 n=1 Tax=Streptomyces sp. NPDC059766 TaxID=3346940 RepID=UPI0036487C3B
MTLTERSPEIRRSIVQLHVLTEFQKRWLDCEDRLGCTLFVIRVRSASGQHPKAVATLRTLGLRRIGDFRLLADGPRARGMLRAVSHLIKVTSPVSFEAIQVMESRRGRAMAISTFRDESESQNLIRFKTSEYASREDYTEDTAIAWTSTISYAEALELAQRYMVNDGEFHIYVSAAPDVDPGVRRSREEATSILTESPEVYFLRVDTRFESFTFGPPSEEVAFEVMELALITENLDHGRIAALMSDSGSPMIEANVIRLLGQLGVTE